MPKRKLQFTQITSHNGLLVGLDADGQVWTYYESNSGAIRDGWYRFQMTEMTEREKGRAGVRS